MNTKCGKQSRAMGKSHPKICRYAPGGLVYTSGASTDPAQDIVGKGSASVGQGSALRNRWIKKEGEFLVVAVEDVQDTPRQLLQEIQATKSVSDAKVLADLKKRKLITVQKAISYTIRKGPKYAKEIPVEVTDLTAEMLANGSWATANFKPYNFKALGAGQNAGALHPLNKVRTEFRNIFFNQGFVEMPTSRYGHIQT